MPNNLIKFADFELDGGRYELRRGDHVLRLEKIPMELLTILVESAGQLVTREQIIEKIWGKDVFLDTEHGINTAIRKIRQALGDDPDQPRFLQTVTGKGYRFIAPTTVVAPSNGTGNRIESGAVAHPSVTSGQPLNKEAIREQSPVSSSAKAGATLRRIALSLTATICVAAILIGFNIRGVRDRWFSTAKPLIHSLAVLPLENLSSDPAQDYFADGMTDELITMLAKNPGLRVVSRTSVMQYKKVHRPLSDIAGELGVDGILEGSVERSGNRVHLNAQLIYAPQDRHVWAESYDRDLSDVGSLQSDLARTIAQQVGLTASATLAPARRIAPEAHDAYLLGRYYWFARSYQKAGESFQKAIQLQPDYAAAWAGIADYYTASAAEDEIPSAQALAHAEPAARKAIALDDSLAQAHHAMAAVHYFLRWDWDSAERESTRAVELDLHFSESHHLHAYILQTLQRTDAAVEEDRKSMELDPFVRPWALGHALIRARRFDAALSELRARAEAQPNDCGIQWTLSDVYFHKGMAAEYLHAMERCASKEHIPQMEQAFQRGGVTGVLEWNLGRLKRAAANGYVSPLEFADAYARLGRKDESIRALEQSYQIRQAWLVHIQNDPDLDILHSDPRYQAIVKKMGLPPAY
ncbi:MAG TPA: winged helix-turn-helix domain-containing protein [Terriglobales bacterium]|nr:winged helix-turn-helix domain-containing protein [Terriglobales bacterium]